MKKKNPGSFRVGLTLATLLCWILPIVIITTMAGVLLNQSYNRNIRRNVQADMDNAVSQVELRLDTVIEDSKAVSYDGTVRQAYREYRQSGIKFGVYRTVSDYLAQRFGRDLSCRAVFVSFLDEELDILPYTCTVGISRLQLLRDYSSKVLPAARELMSGHDTGIFFMAQGGRLYMVRNLLDSNFEAYALLVIQLQSSELFQSLYGLGQIQDLELTIDGVNVPLNGESEPEVSADADMFSAVETDGHIIRCTGRLEGVDLWGSVPMLRWAIGIVASMVFPLAILIIWLFYRNVNHPMEILIDANSRVQNGQRGYQIQQEPPNSEFSQLFSHFNSMSSELSSQFEQLYEEQQALQQAKIKALQSQINPHFLNNTLEIINWEARLADNERVCSMIEALSTMLDAAIGRSGKSQGPLSEEMKYVEAYLYITQERLGDRLIVTREIDPGMEDQTIPLLLLQPIIENAVEYDLSRTGGELCLRAYQEDNDLYFEVEHDGSITADGWKKIRRSLDAPRNSESEPQGRGSVGIRNVNHRLALIYGDRYSFDISERDPGRIVAKIVLYGAAMPTIANNGQE